MTCKGGASRWSVVLIFLLLFSSAGCGRSPKPFTLDVSTSDATRVWSAYERRLKNKEIPGPYRLQARLTRYHERKIYRSKVVAWSNGILPLRLDVTVGLGTVVVQIQEDVAGSTAYFPSERAFAAYSSEDRFSFGMGSPMPFRLYELAALVRGQFWVAFGDVRGTPLYGDPDGSVAYALSGGNFGGELTLSSEGLPIKWADSELGWSLELKYAKAENLPESLIVTGPDEDKIVLTVISMEDLKEPFESRKLKLNIPLDAVLQGEKGAR